MLLDINTLSAAFGVMSAHLNSSAGCLTPENHAKALREVLSPAAKIHLPGSAEFDAASTRWSSLEVPTVDIAVVPATEGDVVETVKYANEVELPVLAFNGAHGAITTLGRMDSAVTAVLRYIWASGQLSKSIESINWQRLVVAHLPRPL